MQRYFQFGDTPVAPTVAVKHGAQMSEGHQKAYLDGGVKKFEVYVLKRDYDEVRSALRRVGKKLGMEQNGRIFLECLRRIANEND